MDRDLFSSWQPNPNVSLGAFPVKELERYEFERRFRREPTNKDDIRGMLRANQIFKMWRNKLFPLPTELNTNECKAFRSMFIELENRYGEGSTGFFAGHIARLNPLCRRVWKDEDERDPDDIVIPRNITMIHDKI